MQEKHLHMFSIDAAWQGYVFSLLLVECMDEEPTDGSRGLAIFVEGLGL